MGNKNFRIYLKPRNKKRIKYLARWCGESIDHMINRLLDDELIAVADNIEDFDKKIICQVLHSMHD